MAAGKRSTVDETLSRIHGLRGALHTGGSNAQAAAELAKALTSKTALVVAKAADVAREAKLDALAPQLTEAFARFLDQRPEADKGCAAKIALAMALADLDVDASPLFLRGIRVVQMEAVW